MARTLSLQQAAELLGVHYMTVYRYVRLGRLPARKRGSVWRVDEADLAALRGLGPPPPIPTPAAWEHRLEARLLAGDERGAWALVEAAMASGRSPAALYLEVLAPALRSIGRRWSEGEIGIGDEHRATVIATRIMGRLGPRFSRRGRTRGTVLVGTAPGERHGVAVSMLADLLRGAGFHAIDLGADLPVEAFVAAMLEADRLRAIGVSAFHGGNEAAVSTTLAILKDSARDTVPVLVGGAAVDGEGHARRLGADGWAADAAAAVALVERLCATG